MSNGYDPDANRRRAWENTVGFVKSIPDRLGSLDKAVGFDTPLLPPSTPDQRTVGAVVESAAARTAAARGQSEANKAQTGRTFAASTAAGHAKNDPPSTGTPTPPAEAPKRGDYYGGVKATRTRGGGIVFSGPERQAEMGRGGGRGMDYDTAIAEARGAAPGAGFIRPDPVLGRPRPTSEKMLELATTGPDINDPGANWSFKGGYVETGKPGPREGTSRAPGVEQSRLWREYIEGRRREEQVSELGDVEYASRRAQMERVTRNAEIDPRELAQIEAMGRYGGAAITAQQRLHAERLAGVIYDAYADRIGTVREQQSKHEMGSREWQYAEGLIRALEQERRERTNVALGRYLADPRDWFSALIAGGLGMVPGAAGGTTPGPAQ